MRKRTWRLIWKQYKGAIVYGVIFSVFGIIALVIAIGNSKQDGVKMDREDLATSWLVSQNGVEPSGSDSAEPQKTPETDTKKGDAKPEGESTEKETESTTVKEKDTTAASEDGQTFTVVQTDGYVNIYSEADVNAEVAGTLASGFTGTVLQYGKWMCQIDYQGVRGWVETNYLEVK